MASKYGYEELKLVELETFSKSDRVVIFIFNLNNLKRAYKCKIYFYLFKMNIEIGN